jgi:alcohol dehydrogenase (cytochrome c)
VLDRVTGEFLTGVPFVQIDWAKGLTPSGRPILVDAAKVSTAGRRIRPGIEATNWQNPAFDQERGTIFVPATEVSSVFAKRPPNEMTIGPNGYAIGSGWSQIEPPTRLIIALDAASGAQKWRYRQSVSGRDYSGLLGTGGGLVFGASGGFLLALDADSGREIFKQSLGGSTKSAPISFTIDGKQVIAVAAGRALFVFGL